MRSAGLPGSAATAASSARVTDGSTDTRWGYPEICSISPPEPLHSRARAPTLNDMSSSQRPYSHLRASDAERERVVAFLREHALQGRLTHDELEERIGLAYSAVYVGDLERLIGDLPRSAQPATRHHRRPPAPPRKRKREPNPALIVAGV